MRMLALMTDAYGGYGGIAQYNRDFIEAAAEVSTVRSIDVAVRIAPIGGTVPPPNVRQHKPRRSRVHYALHSASLAVVRRPKLVFNGHLYHGPLARMIAKATGAKLISQLHGTEVWGGIRPSHLAALHASNIVLCVSRHTHDQALARAPALEGKLVVVPNMVGAQFNPGDRTAARARFGLHDEKVILTVGRLDGRNGYKGHDRVLRLLPDLLNRYGKVQYLIAGQGEDRERLECLAADLGVTTATRFLGRVPDKDLPDLYRAADVFAMPSAGEGFGIVYLEAMACGTPAIGLDVGGVRDAFADGRIWGCVPSSKFEDALNQALTAPPMSSTQLSKDVQDRFGARSFKARIGEITNELRMH
jgi:phosphatidylinositol alpha-1,6-mannosyltransferase